MDWHGKEQTNGLAILLMAKLDFTMAMVVAALWEF